MACPKSMIPFLAQAGREVVFFPLEETKDGAIAFENKDEILNSNQYKGSIMVVIGPGLSTNEDPQKLVRVLAREIEKPLLIDGDGITALFGREGERKEEGTEIIKSRKDPTILTPHTGEMGRNTGIKRIEVEKNRVDISQQTAKE